MKKTHKENQLIVSHLASDLKEVNDKFLALLVNEDYQSLSSKKEMNSLSRALRNINKYTSDMEDRLYKDNLLDINTFYSGGVK